MANYQLNAEVRQESGKGPARRLRQQNLVPGNIYGKEESNALVSLRLGELDKAIQSGANLIDLSLGNETRTVIIKDLQFEPVRGRIQHVDFFEVSMDQAIDTVTPIAIVGEDVRESDGGIVNQVLRELSISCLPGDIPDTITVDISKLVIGDTISVADLEIPAGVTVLTESDEVVVTITAPEAEETEEDVTDDELTDEEVVDADEETEEATEE